MAKSIPASQLVNVIPSVLGAGGNPLSLNAVFLTGDTSPPIGTVLAFTTLAAVQAWFGATSTEAKLAAVYFSGFTGATTLPGTLYFYQYNAAAVSAYLRGGSFAGVALSVIQALSGTLVIAVDGRTLTSAAINLSSATSPSNAAALIQTGLQTTGNVWTGTLTVTNTSTTVTINTTTTGQLHVGDVLVGTDIPIGATIVSFGTYTTVAGTGTVVISAAATGAAGPEAGTVTLAPTVTYDALRAAFVITSPTTGVSSSVAYPTTGALATGLLLTQVAGAVQSIGAAAATPAGAMNGVVAATQNWATFMTTFDPDNGTLPPTNKLAFANWVSTASPAGAERFLYAAWDTDQGPAAAANDASSFGALVTAAQYNGVAIEWDQSALTSGHVAGEKAAFICAIAASTDFTATNGRVDYAYRAQAGLPVDVTDATTASNLESNGYNFYGSYSTANQAFTFLQPGSTPGAWEWIDPYVNQIWLNAAFQLALMELLANSKSIPYTVSGYNLIRSALLDPINAALNAGVIRAGVALSASQIQQINTAAGNSTAAAAVQNIGWYLQVKDPGAIVRGQRGSPSITFWYADGGSIQKITMASIDVQ